MKKFQTAEELVPYLLCTNCPNELQNRALEKMLAVEECNHGGATAFILFAETKAEAEQAETEYALWNRIPEQDETTETLNGVYWRERMYVFGDDGGGIVYFRRVPLLDEK